MDDKAEKGKAGSRFVRGVARFAGYAAACAARHVFSKNHVLQGEITAIQRVHAAPGVSGVPLEGDVRQREVTAVAVHAPACKGGFVAVENDIRQRRIVVVRVHAATALASVIRESDARKR